MVVDESEMDRRLIALSQSPDCRCWRLDYADLSEPERVFRAIWELQGEVGNGGFHQYFFNTSGSLAIGAADSLRVIGAATTAAIVERAVEILGRDTCWPDRDARIARFEVLSPIALEQLNSLDQAFYAYPDNLTVLLYRYACVQMTEILRFRAC